MQPIVSKLYCSQHEAVLLVRRRPKVANGGGLAVVDATQRVIFTVDGCPTLGKKEELLLKDGNGNALLLIRHTGGIIEAVALTRKWKCFSYDYLGSPKPVFTLKQPNSCFNSASNSSIRISAGPAAFGIRGDLADGSCAVVDAAGLLIAEVGVKTREDLYCVKIMGGADQVFVVGVVAVLDYINGGSTAC